MSLAELYRMDKDLVCTTNQELNYAIDNLNEQYNRKYGYKFIGTNSLGFENGKVYWLEIKKKLFRKAIHISEFNGLGCMYSSKKKFKENWIKI